MRYSLAPSLPAQSWDELNELWSLFQGTLPELQIDIVDGKFVAPVSWPFSDPHGIRAITQAQTFVPTAIEVDCMCMHPEAYLDFFLQIPVRRVVVHAGSTDAGTYYECLTHAKAHGYAIGLGVMNDVSRALLSDTIPDFDYVQVMGIARIGVQGQPFDERTIDTVEYLRATYPELEIAVDGAVNEETIPRLLKAGANRFAPGSAITRAPDPVAAYKQLLALLPL